MFSFWQTGAIFDEDDVYGLSVLDIAISRQNVFTKQFRLEPLIKAIPSMDAAQVERAGLVQQQQINSIRTP